MAMMKWVGLALVMTLVVSPAMAETANIVHPVDPAAKHVTLEPGSSVGSLPTGETKPLEKSEIKVVKEGVVAPTEVKPTEKTPETEIKKTTDIKKE